MSSPQSSALGGMIRSKRKEMGLSQTALAELAGVNQIDISRYERGEAPPTFERLIRVSEVLSISLGDLDGLKVAA